MSEFKVGDEVRFLGLELTGLSSKDQARCYYPLKGTIGIVENIGVGAFHSLYYIQWPPGTTNQEGRWWCEEEALEEVIGEPHSFKVGDVVSLTGAPPRELLAEDSEYSYCPRMGTMGTVTQVSFSSCQVRWPKDSCRSGDSPWWHLSKYLQLVPNSPSDLYKEILL